LSRRLDCRTGYRDAIFNQKELGRLHKAFNSYCFTENGIYCTSCSFLECIYSYGTPEFGTNFFSDWDQSAVINFVESAIPEHAKSKLYICSETIWNSVLFLINYPFSPSRKTLLEYDDFVRACAFLTGKAEVVYRAPHVDESVVWTAQYSRQPQTIISDVILKSIVQLDPDVDICLEIPDKDVFELLATLQPIHDKNSIPHYQSQL
jgi:hypothetical protein